jgi:hypothetical protein
MSDLGAHIGYKEKTVLSWNPGGGRNTHQGDRHTLMKVEYSKNYLMKLSQGIYHETISSWMYFHGKTGNVLGQELEFTTDLNSHTTTCGSVFLQ